MESKTKIDPKQSRDEIQLHELAKSGDSVSKLLRKRKQININSVDSAGYTALMHAAQRGHLNVVQEIVSSNRGVDLSVSRTSDRATAVQLAMDGNHRTCWHYLRDSKADLWFRDANGETALHRLQRQIKQGGPHSEASAVQTLRELLELNDGKTHLNGQNTDGKTAQGFAEVQGYHGIADLLRAANRDENAEAVASQWKAYREFTWRTISELQSELEDVQKSAVRNSCAAGYPKIEFFDLEIFNASFRFEHELGAGGFGSASTGTFHGKRVVYKKVATFRRDALHCLRKEAEMLPRVNSPYVVTLEAVVTTRVEDIPRICGLVLEHIDGRPLSQCIFSVCEKCEGKRACEWHLALSVPSRWNIVLEVAKALKVLRAHGMVHRDVKPSNIMMRNDTGAIVLLDFGTARALGDTTTREGIMTRDYTAPELLLQADVPKADEPVNVAQEVKQEDDTDRTQSDVYAYAILVVEVFSAKRWKLQDLEKQKDIEASRIPSSVPEGVRGLVLQCLKTDPSERPDFDYVCDTLTSLVSGKDQGGGKGGVGKDDGKDNVSKAGETQ